MTVLICMKKQAEMLLLMHIIKILSRKNIQWLIQELWHRTREEVHQEMLTLRHNLICKLLPVDLKMTIKIIIWKRIKHSKLLRFIRMIMDKQIMSTSIFRIIKIEVEKQGYSLDTMHQVLVLCQESLNFQQIRTSTQWRTMFNLVRLKSKFSSNIKMLMVSCLSSKA